MYREYKPNAPLASSVECFWTLEAGARPFSHLVLPDGCVDIVFWAEGGLRAVGAMTSGLVTPVPAGGRFCGVRFRPGRAGRFLRNAPSELTGDWAGLESLWGGPARILKEQLSETASPMQQVHLLASALKVPELAESPFDKAMSAVIVANGALGLEDAARHANLSARQFRRRCLEETGLAPKQLFRVLRFRRALRLLSLAPRRGWAQLAAECGYYDQAHLIRDFRQFSGSTPVQLASGDGRFFQSPEPSNRVIFSA